MIVILSSIIIINLLLSLDNIIPILLVADSLPTKRHKTYALLFGLVIGAILRLGFVIFASFIFSFGEVIYLICGVFLLYIGIKGLREEHEDTIEKRKAGISFREVIFSIVIIDLTLSLDNIAAILAITQNDIFLVVGVLLSVLILFALSFSINTVLHKISGLDTAAYAAIVFLGLKFLVTPVFIFSNTLTSAFVIGICIVTVLGKSSVLNTMRPRLSRKAY